MERPLASKALRLLLKPIVCFCLRHSLRLPELYRLTKEIFLEEAKRIIQNAGLRVTNSRLSIMTGIHRREVAALSGARLAADSPEDLITKVIGLWQTGPSFVTKTKKPRILTAGFQGCSFNKLVESVNKDLNPATVLFELQRLGAVERYGERVKLLAASHVPSGDILAGFSILAKDSEDLIGAAEENLLRKQETLNLHLRTEYERIRAGAEPAIKQWLSAEGHLFHRRARDFLAGFDQDINPQAGYKGDFIRVVLGSFSRVLSPERNLSPPTNSLALSGIKLQAGRPASKLRRRREKLSSEEN